MSNNKKQTAIDWLMENIDIDFNVETNTISMRQDIWEQAKQMEKEELGLSFARGYMTGYAGANGVESMDFDEYYNKTYNQ